MSQFSKILTADKFGEQVCAALGIDAAKTPVRRVVLDATANEPLRVYVELLGTNALLDVQIPAADIDIVWGPPDAAQ